MAIIQTTALTEVTILPLEQSIQVKWTDSITNDGDVISKKDHYRVFTAGQQAEFEAEVEGAASYVGLIDWTGGSTPVVPTVPQVITARQAKRALYAAGLLDTVETAVAAASREVQIEWAEATEFRRTWPTLLAMQAALGLTDQQIDDLFTAGAQL